jgi:hypothetical protein
MAIRIPLQADRQLVDAHRDTDNELEKLKGEIRDLKTRLGKLEKPTISEAAHTLTRLGDTQVSGQLYVAGPSNFRGSFTAPYQNLGLADMEPLTNVDPPGKTKVFDIHGSLRVQSAIVCETITARSIIPSPGHYGQVNIVENATSLTLTNQNQFYQWTAGWAVDPSVSTSGLAWDSDNSRFTICCKGIYHAAASLTVLCGSANQDLTFQLFVNGSSVINHQDVYFQSSGIHMDVAFGTLIKLQPGDYVDLRIENVTSAGKTVTVEDAIFSLMMVTAIT